MANALVPYTGDDLSRAQHWATLPADERRRVATAAARDRDAGALWELLEAHLMLHGSAGAHLSPHTALAYRRAVDVLLQAWQGQNLLRPQPDAAAVWIRSMERSGLSASTISVRLAGARALYRALRWTGAVAHDPLADVRPARDPTPADQKRHPYSDSDVDRLLSCAGEHDRVLILLGAHAGLRISEALALCWQDIDLASHRLTVMRGKGRKLRVVTISRSLVTALAAVERSDSYVLPYRSPANARLRLARLCRDAGVSYLGIHALRHTCGTRIYRETGKLENAQKHLGHAHLSTTQVYAAWSDEGLKRHLNEW